MRSQIFVVSGIVSSFVMSAALAASLDIQPDCSERKIGIEEIVSIAEKPEIKTMVQFLGALPKGSLQTFTFVANTGSIQHHGVGEQWPRVLRMTADGKVAMSFVCNPESQDYGEVEILHFVDGSKDKPEDRWKSVSLKFDKREATYGKLSAASFNKNEEPRVSRDSTVCLKCHGVGSSRQEIRPIFASYPSWPGFFGSDDDTLAIGSRELSVFQQFRKLAAQDACYQTLPWPKKVPAGYEHYPYHAIQKPGASENPYINQQYIRDLKTTNYHVRPNLKFTDAFSHLLAIRLTRKLLREKDYLRVSPLLAMESLGCKIDFDAELRKVLGSKYKKPAFIDAVDSMDPRSSASGSLRLYTVASLLGVNPDEWTLHFNRPNDPQFATGVQGAYGNDNSVSRLVQSLLLQELAKTVPGLKENFRLSRGVSAFFKDQNFSCIDDLGGAIEFDKIENQKAMCESLATAHRDKAGERLSIAPMPSIELREKSRVQLPEVRTALVKEFKSNAKAVATASTGASVIQTYCTSCHGKDSYLPMYYRFLTSDSDFKKAVTNDPLLLFRALAHIESGRMPLGYNLKDDERRSLQGYLLKTAGGNL